MLKMVKFNFKTTIKRKNCNFKKILINFKTLLRVCESHGPHMKTYENNYI